MVTTSIQQRWAIIRRRAKSVARQSLARARRVPCPGRPTIRRGASPLYSLTLLAVLLATSFVPPAQTQLPNPFCNLLQLIHDWMGAIIAATVVLAAVGLLMRQFGGDRFSHSQSNTFFGLAAGVFILGLVFTNNGAGLEAIGHALGLDFTLGCNIQ